MNPLPPASKLAARTALRSANPRAAIRLQSRRVPSPRYQSTEAVPSGGSGALLGGVVGGTLVGLGGYAWYHFSGAKQVVSTITDTKKYFDDSIKKVSEKAPEPNQAIKWMRDTTTSYAAFIPGAKTYVDTAFDDIETIQQKHGSEVDKIVKQTYDDLKDVSKEGMSIETVQKGWEVLQKHMKEIADLAGDAADDLLKNHPEAKEKLGGSLDQLKSMGKKLGPEAQKQVDETWSQIQDIVKGGLGVGTIAKIQKLIQDKSEELKKFGDEAWKKGMEQAKPLLDKQPQLKDMFEKNKDKLLQGDLGKLWDQIQEAIKTGKTDDVEKFVKDQVSKAGDTAKQGGSSGLDQLFKMIPGGQEILPKLQQLQEISEKHGKEAEKLIKDALDDIKAVLEKKVNEGKKLAEDAKDDAKDAAKDKGKKK